MEKKGSAGLYIPEVCCFRPSRYVIGFVGPEAHCCWKSDGGGGSGDGGGGGEIERARIASGVRSRAALCRPRLCSAASVRLRA